MVGETEEESEQMMLDDIQVAKLKSGDPAATQDIIQKNKKKRKNNKKKNRSTKDSTANKVQMSSDSVNLIRGLLKKYGLDEEEV